MSQDDLERWKNKYLEIVERQEQVESRWEARLDLVRRGLTRTSIAAEGNDKKVDACLNDLRTILRQKDMDEDLARLIPRLEKTVLESEQRRSERAERGAQAFAELAQLLLELPIPRDIRKPIKRFAKKAAESAEQPGDFPSLLVELSRLQRDALNAVQSAKPQRPGLLERLLGKGGTEVPSVQQDTKQPVSDFDDDADEDDKPVGNAPAAVVTLAPDEQQTVDESVPAAEALSPTVEKVAEPVQSASADIIAQPDQAATETAVSGESVGEIADAPVTALESEHPATTEVSNTDGDTAIEPLVPEEPALSEPVVLVAETPAVVDSLGESPSEDEAYSLPPMPEPGYSTIAPHIEATLLHLLDELELPDTHKPQAEALRERMYGRLNWYELVPLLDDLSGLVLSLNDQGHREFEGYLKQLNHRLEAFQDHLRTVNDGHDAARDEERTFSESLLGQVTDLQTHVQAAAELDDLKVTLESRLDGMLASMERFQQQRAQREQDMAQRLQVLSERVVSMEEEANTYRSHVEEQRKKALTDPLTGLPNRAAWSERLDVEVSRWQRHKEPLLLAVLDIDHFKRINDDFGHLAGDKVLKIIAGQLGRRIRPTDFLARYGGEEFVLLMPKLPAEDGLSLVEDLRRTIEACPFHFKGERVTITCSVGLTAFQIGEGSKQAFERADQALYRAKRTGRNRVELA
ncbi:diguanylate cyclase [Pseudomonas duriflava]|uniref:diguanylate cyclase n=1 Tax=Pseudomonas duriflava TaxID=459528 RepID=A0A562QIM5_9PSED|nr:GGDEF domain-containing protein [Pseudomonas duriflava]TWI56565.1 diguanylate cyclase [Pseudomonas duriflava]